MSTTDTTQDQADQAALDKYVANRAGELYAAGHVEEASAMLRKHQLDFFEACEAATRQAGRPGTGDRIAGAIVGVGKGAYIPFMVSLAAGAFVGPHAAAAVGSFAVLCGAVGALCGFVTGGK